MLSVYTRVNFICEKIMVTIILLVKHLFGGMLLETRSNFPSQFLYKILDLITFLCFVAICLLPSTAGPCRGNFERWYFDVGMQKCLPFSYGGCRGNENRFETMDECTEACAVSQSHPQQHNNTSSESQPSTAASRGN